MCYGCELKSTFGEKTVEEYLDIRGDYEVMNAHMIELLKRMAAFETTITDREQRKAWHATRKRISLAKKMAGEAMSHVRPNAAGNRQQGEKDMVKNTETPNDDTTKKGGSLLSALTGGVMRFADKRLIAENDRLAGLLAQKLVDQTIINEMTLTGNQLSMELEGGMCRVMAESFAEQFVSSGAKNYLEVSFTSKKFPGDLLVVTIQKMSGKTPHQFRAEAEAKVKELESKLGA